MCLDLNLRRDRVCTEAQTWHTPSSNGESTGWEPGTSRFQYLHDVGDDEPHWPCEEEGGLDEPISHSPALDAGPIPLDAGGVGAGRSGGAGESAWVFADHLMQERAVHAAKMARECALLARQAAISLGRPRSFSPALARGGFDSSCAAAGGGGGGDTQARRMMRGLADVTMS